MRVNRLLRELNIGLQTLYELLQALGIDVPDYSPSAKISDDIANLIIKIYNDNLDFLKLVEVGSQKNTSNSGQDIKSQLKILGKIDLDDFLHLKRQDTAFRTDYKSPLEKYTDNDAPHYDESNKEFWVEELILLSSIGEAKRLLIASFHNPDAEPLYSVLIGNNGVGKSTMLKEIVDFFIDLHAYTNGDKSKISSANKARLRGVKYHIDGVCCEVIRLGKTFISKIDDKLRSTKKLRLPLVVACNFGAFDKFPVQRVNGSSQTRYDVPYYKYVGAHVNGNMISSSAIAFRLLFALSENMDERQRQNITSILDFINYDYKISLNYSIVQKSKNFGDVHENILQRVKSDIEYAKLTPEKKKNIVSDLYVFYSKKNFNKNVQYSYEIDFAKNPSVTDNDLKIIYKLKQYDLVNSTSVVFYKQGNQIASEEMSSGEFAMLSMVLSVSTSANDAHTLVLLDEPELSLHPNWQMSFIDNLDRALMHQACHLLIATHSHMLVSDLPMNRSSVSQLEVDKEGRLESHQIGENTYGWSAEEVLLKVFKTATDRNRYFGERIAKLLEKMGNGEINPKEVSDELNELQEISLHLSDVDPMKMVLNTIVEAYK